MNLLNVLQDRPARVPYFHHACHVSSKVQERMRPAVHSPDTTTTHPHTLFVVLARSMMHTGVHRQSHVSNAVLRGEVKWTTVSLRVGLTPHALRLGSSCNAGFGSGSGGNARADTDTDGKE